MDFTKLKPIQSDNAIKQQVIRRVEHLVNYVNLSGKCKTNSIIIVKNIDTGNEMLRISIRNLGNNERDSFKFYQYLDKVKKDYSRIKIEEKLSLDANYFRDVEKNNTVLI